MRKTKKAHVGESGRKRRDGPEPVFTFVFFGLRVSPVVSWAKNPVQMPKCVTDIVIVEPFTWHSVRVSLFNCPDAPLPESLLCKKKRQHYFLQKLTSRLNQGALYQYYTSRRCCQSVCVQLTSHSSGSSAVSEANVAVCPRSGPSRSANEAPALRDLRLPCCLLG